MCRYCNVTNLTQCNISGVRGVQRGVLVGVQTTKRRGDAAIFTRRGGVFFEHKEDNRPG